MRSDGSPVPFYVDTTRVGVIGVALGGTIPPRLGPAAVQPSEDEQPSALPLGVDVAPASDKGVVSVDGNRNAELVAANRRTWGELAFLFPGSTLAREDISGSDVLSTLVIPVGPDDDSALTGVDRVAEIVVGLALLGGETPRGREFCDGDIATSVGKNRADCRDGSQNMS